VTWSLELAVWARAKATSLLGCRWVGGQGDQVHQEQHREAIGGETAWNIATYFNSSSEHGEGGLQVYKLLVLITSKLCE
jgi:hypothetical protein